MSSANASASFAGASLKRNGEVVRDAWRVCVSLGMETYIDKDGNERKRRRKAQKTVHGTLAEARIVKVERKTA